MDPHISTNIHLRQHDLIEFYARNLLRLALDDAERLANRCEARDQLSLVALLASGIKGAISSSKLRLVPVQATMLPAKTAIRAAKKINLLRITA